MKITAGNISIEIEKELVSQQNITMAIEAAQQLVALQTQRKGIDLGLDLKAVEEAEKMKAHGA